MTEYLRYLRCFKRSIKYRHRISVAVTLRVVLSQMIRRVFYQTLGEQVGRKVNATKAFETPKRQGARWNACEKKSALQQVNGDVVPSLHQDYVTRMPTNLRPHANARSLVHVKICRQYTCVCARAFVYQVYTRVYAYTCAHILHTHSSTYLKKKRDVSILQVQRPISPKLAFKKG